jgi:hypothetical protein
MGGLFFLIEAKSRSVVAETIAERGERVYVPERNLTDRGRENFFKHFHDAQLTSLTPAFATRALSPKQESENVHLLSECCSHSGFEIWYSSNLR